MNGCVAYEYTSGMKATPVPSCHKHCGCCKKCARCLPQCTSPPPIEVPNSVRSLLSRRRWGSAGACRRCAHGFKATWHLSTISCTSCCDRRLSYPFQSPWLPQRTQCSRRRWCSTSFDPWGLHRPHRLSDSYYVGPTSAAPQSSQTLVGARGMATIALCCATSNQGVAQEPGSRQEIRQQDAVQPRQGASTGGMLLQVACKLQINIKAGVHVGAYSVPRFR